VLQLLSPLRKPPSSTSFASTESALSSPTLPVGDELFPNKSSSSHTVMYIDILPERSPDTIRNKSSCSAWSDTGDVVRASEYPRRLGSINPTICFTSRSRIVARARFTVYSEDLILHTETVPLLLLVGHSSETSGFVYATQLVPKYWQVLLHSPGAGIHYASVSRTDTALADPTRFTISQEVVKDSDLTILFSATYKFRYSWARHNPRPNLPTSDITAHNRLTSLPGHQHTTYRGAPWTPLLLHSGAHSLVQRYPSPGSDSSSASVYFPADLSYCVRIVPFTSRPNKRLTRDS
jgi:hypothetical protein